jgi:DNA-directed RNA polymerase III subunit RPC3
VAQLGRIANLDPRKTKHALCVLIQQNLLYHQTPISGGRESFYEANTTTCYNLLRIGKALSLIAEQHGPAEEDVAQTLLLAGHAKIEDLEKRVLARAIRTRDAGGEAPDAEHEDATAKTQPLSEIRSVPHLHQTLYNLLRADLLEVVGSHAFQSAEDLYRDIEADLARTTSIANQIKKGAERDRAIADRFRDAQEEPNVLKRQLDPGPNFPVKRRRLTHGSNGVESQGTDFDFDEDSSQGPTLSVRCCPLHTLGMLLTCC